MRNKVVKLITDSKHAFFSQVSENVRNPQKFWHVMKSLMSTSCNSLPNLSLADGSAVTKTDLEKAEALNEYVCKCFNKLVPPLACSNLTLKQNPYIIPEICQIDITADEIQHLLSSSSPRKAHGVDGITPNMLCITAASIAPSIALLFKGGRVTIAFFVNYSTVAFPLHLPTLKRQQFFGAVANSLGKNSYFPLPLDVRRCVAPTGEEVDARQRGVN